MKEDRQLDQYLKGTNSGQMSEILSYIESI